MPFPGQYANPIGGNDVVNDEFVAQTLQDIELDTYAANIVKSDIAGKHVQNVNENTGRKLRYLYSCDGGSRPLSRDRKLQDETNSPTDPTLNYKRFKYTQIAVKTALIKLDIDMLTDDYTFEDTRVRKNVDTSIYWVLLPVRGCKYKGDDNPLQNMTRIIFQRISKDPDILETLKWITYKKWRKDSKKSVPFRCPYCRKVGLTAVLGYDQETGTCTNEQCEHREIFISDYALAFGESVRGPTRLEDIGRIYMHVHELLLIFNEIRKLWENERNRFDDSLFMLDGTMFTNQPPLACNIMQFLKYASTEGYTVHMLSQIKKGEFVDHLTHMSEFLSKNCVFLLKDYYIKRHIQGLPDIEIGKPGKQAFGEKYNWGVPMFHKDKNGK